MLDCDIQYCLLQNGKLHFVFTRSNNGWAELVYSTIDIGTNAFFASTFNGVASNENFLRPSIACYGADSTDENYLIGFLRTGPNQFPEVCAINYDSTGWSIVATSLKNGLGLSKWLAGLASIHADPQESPNKSSRGWVDFPAWGGMGRWNLLLFCCNMCNKMPLNMLINNSLAYLVGPKKN